jgi:carbon monoxide dehydrogenase subunit G
MNLEGRKIIVNKSCNDLFAMLKNPKDFEHLLPQLKKFEATEDGFTFGLAGMPEVSLKITEMVENEKVVLQSASSLDFSLTGLLNPLNAQQTEVQLLFDGKFNAFMRMVVEKPLQKFIDDFSNKLETLS